MPSTGIKIYTDIQEHLFFYQWVLLWTLLALSRADLTNESNTVTTQITELKEKKCETISKKKAEQ